MFLYEVHDAKDGPESRLDLNSCRDCEGPATLTWRLLYDPGLSQVRTGVVPSQGGGSDPVSALLRSSFRFPPEGTGSKEILYGDTVFLLKLDFRKLFSE